MYRRLSLAVVLLGAAGLVVADEKKEGPKESMPIQGKWKVVRMDRRGEPQPKDRWDKVQFLFHGDEFTRTGPNDRQERAKYRLNTSRVPAEIDILPEKGPQKVLGIYKLDRNTLTICYALEGKQDRPKQFESTKDPPTTLLVLEKVKD